MPTIRETPNPRFTLLLYGMPKIGKTSTAAQFPNPLILDCEPGGTDFVVGLPIEPVRSLADVRTAIHKYGANYDTIVIDGITWLINREVDEANKNKKDPRRGYATVVGALRELLAYALDQNKIIVATGHHRSAATPINPEAPNSPTRTEIRPDVSPALADDLFGLFSVVLYCFASNGKSKAITKPRVTPAQDIYAGDRSGRLPEIIDLSAQAILTGLGFATVPANKVSSPTEKPATQEQPTPPPVVPTEEKTAAPTPPPPSQNGNGNGSKSKNGNSPRPDIFTKRAEAIYGDNAPLALAALCRLASGGKRSALAELDATQMVALDTSLALRMELHATGVEKYGKDWTATLHKAVRGRNELYDLDAELGDEAVRQMITAIQKK